MAVFPSASPKDYPSFGDISRDFMTKRKTAQQNDADARAQSTPLVTPSAGPPSTDTAAGQGAGGYSTAKTSQAAGGQASSSAGSSVQTAPQNNPLDEYYAQMKSAQRAAAAAQEAQTRAAVEALQGNRRTIEQDAEEAAKQAYISRMLTEKRLPQQLAATGSSGGMTDSAVLRMNSDYENSRNDIMNAKNNALADLNNQIVQVEATGDISLAQQQSEWAQQLAQMQWQLAQQEAERQHELELAAINASKSGGKGGLSISELRGLYNDGLIDRETFYELSGIPHTAQETLTGAITNRTGAGWIAVDGLGRFSTAELSKLLDNGTVLAIRNVDGSITYQRA